MRISKGFTLAELLVAASIAGILGLAFFSLFSAELKVYKRIVLHSAQLSDCMLVLERFHDRIGSAVPFSPVRFAGDEREISFCAAAGVADGAKGPTTAFRQIRYYWDDALKTLIEESSAYPYDGISRRERRIYSIENVSFGYLVFDREKNKHVWEKRWRGAGMPRGVKMEITFTNDRRTECLSRPVYVRISDP